MDTVERYDIIIIGQGYSGLTAAKLAVDRGLRTANIESGCMGGLIININELDPAPEGAERSGAELASNLAMSNMDKGVATLSGAVTAIERDGNSWVVKTDYETCSAPHVIVASGARLRKLEVPGEEEFKGQGVSECADCDGPMFRNMETIVVGGGDSAFQEAIALSQFASKVTMILRGKGPRARTELVKRAAALPNLIQLTETRVLAIEGTPGKGVDGVRIRTEGEAERIVPTAGVFIFIGLQPNTEFLPPELPRDPAGALVTSDRCETNLPGVWAIGAVRSGYSGKLSDAENEAGVAIGALA